MLPLQTAVKRLLLTILPLVWELQYTLDVSPTSLRTPTQPLVITSTPSRPCHRVAKTPTSQVLAYPAGCGSQLALARSVTNRTALRTRLIPLSFRGGGRNRGRAAIGWRRNDPLLEDSDSSPDDADTRQLRPSQGQHQGGTEEPTLSPLHHSDQDAAVELSRKKRSQKMVPGTALRRRKRLQQLQQDCADADHAETAAATGTVDAQQVLRRSKEALVTGGPAADSGAVANPPPSSRLPKAYSWVPQPGDDRSAMTLWRTWLLPCGRSSTLNWGIPSSPRHVTSLAM